MTQTNAFAEIVSMTNVAQFFAGLVENAAYTVISDTGRTRVLPTRTSARRFAEALAARTDCESELWHDGRPVAMFAIRFGWCIPLAA
jgi:hypothetical protein